MSTYTLDAAKFPIHDAVVKAALAEYHKGVKEDPPHSNSGTDVRKYQAATFLGGTGWAWCVAFYQWCWKSTGHPLPYKGAGAYDLLNWAVRASWRTTVNGVLPGDGVCWNLGSGHWSMYLRTEGNYIVTIDGNVADAVRICKRPLSQVRGFMHVPEVAHVNTTGNKIAPVNKKISKPKKWQIVTSVNGHKQLVVSGRPLPNLIPFVTKAAKKYKKITIEQTGK